MRRRWPITIGLLTVLAATMSGCGSSEPVEDEQGAAIPPHPGSYRRGIRAVGEARELTELINARQNQAMSELD